MDCSLIVTNSQITTPWSIYAFFISWKLIHGQDKFLFHAKDLIGMNTDIIFQPVDDTSFSCKVG